MRCPKPMIFSLRSSRPRIPCLRLLGVGVRLDEPHGLLVGPAVQGPRQRPDGAGHRGVDVGQGADDDARGERGGVELVLRVQDEGDVQAPAQVLRERAVPCSPWRK